MSSESAAGKPPHTTDILIATAERLIAEHGVLGVSMRQIAAEAGQRNAGVIQYHFGSLDRLLDAILMSRAADLDARRYGIVRDLEAAGRISDLRGLVEAIVIPFAELSAESPYLRFLARVQEYHGGWGNMPLSARRFAPGSVAVVEKIVAALDHLPAGLVHRRVLVSFGFAINVLAFGHEDAAGPPPLTPDELVDMLTAAIGAPVGLTD